MLRIYRNADADGSAGGGSQQANQQTTEAPKKAAVEFSNDQQQLLEAKINEAFGRGAAKAERELTAKIAELESQLKAKAEQPKAESAGKSYSDDDLKKAIAARETELKGLLEQTQKDSQTKLSAAEQRIAALLDKDKTAAIVTAAAKANAIDPSDVVALVGGMVHHGDDGSLVVLNEQGQPKLGKNGDPMTVEDFVATYLAAKPHLVRGANTGGAGSRTANNPNFTTTSNKRPTNWDEATRAFGQALSG